MLQTLGDTRASVPPVGFPTSLTATAADSGNEPDVDAGEAVYRLLMRGSDPEAAEAFDIHVVASVLALAFWESIDESRPLCATAGLESAALSHLVATIFPNAAYLFQQAMDDPVKRSTDEMCLLDLLMTCSTERSEWQAMLAAMISRRAQRADHLWQDLGLRNRGELSRLMQRHFRPLATRNTSDMKWKKFLYRMICRDAGYSLCTAPSCSECIDFEVCFGDESGESRLARVRRSSDLIATATALG